MRQAICSGPVASLRFEWPWWGVGGRGEGSSVGRDQPVQTACGTAQLGSGNQEEVTAIEAQCPEIRSEVRAVARSP